MNPDRDRVRRLIAGNIRRRTFTFSTSAERDAWIARHFPDRQASDVPGLFHVPGGSVRVRCELVTLTDSALERISEADEPEAAQ